MKIQGLTTFYLVMTKETSGGKGPQYYTTQDPSQTHFKTGYILAQTEKHGTNGSTRIKLLKGTTEVRNCSGGGT